jgi:hypothetical protein
VRWIVGPSNGKRRAIRHGKFVEGDFRMGH